MKITNIKRIDKRPRSRWSSRPGSGRVRIHFFPIGENLAESFVYRFSRPYEEYRKHLREVYKQTGLNSQTKAHWSQRAGCSCGCSPAFITNQWGTSDIYVDIEVDGPQATGRDPHAQDRLNAISEVFAQLSSDRTSPSITSESEAAGVGTGAESS